MKKTFTIIVKEVLQREVKIKADSEDEAIDIVQKQYNDGDIVLDSEDFIGEEEIFTLSE